MDTQDRSLARAARTHTHTHTHIYTRNGDVIRILFIIKSVLKVTVAYEDSRKRCGEFLVPFDENHTRITFLRNAICRQEQKAKESQTLDILLGMITLCPSLGALQGKDRAATVRAVVA
jgi:hypothetical protein